MLIHGTLLGLVNLGFAATVRAFPAWSESNQRFASTSLLAATLLMPSGFFLGGLFVYAGDPGLGIVLVPLGGILLFTAVLLTVLALKREDSNTDEASGAKVFRKFAWPNSWPYGR